MDPLNRNRQNIWVNFPTDCILYSGEKKKFQNSFKATEQKIRKFKPTFPLVDITLFLSTAKF